MFRNYKNVKNTKTECIPSTKPAAAGPPINKSLLTPGRRVGLSVRYKSKTPSSTEKKISPLPVSVEKKHDIAPKLDKITKPYSKNDKSNKIENANKSKRLVKIDNEAALKETVTNKELKPTKLEDIFDLKDKNNDTIENNVPNKSIGNFDSVANNKPNDDSTIESNTSTINLNEKVKKQKKKNIVKDTAPVKENLNQNDESLLENTVAEKSVNKRHVNKKNDKESTKDPEIIDNNISQKDQSHLEPVKKHSKEIASESGENINEVINEIKEVKVQLVKEKISSTIKIKNTLAPKLLNENTKISDQTIKLQEVEEHPGKKKHNKRLNTSETLKSTKKKLTEGSETGDEYETCNKSTKKKSPKMPQNVEKKELIGNLKTIESVISPSNVPENQDKSATSNKAFIQRQFTTDSIKTLESNSQDVQTQNSLASTQTSKRSRKSLLATKKHSMCSQDSVTDSSDDDLEDLRMLGDFKRLKHEEESKQSFMEVDVKNCSVNLEKISQSTLSQYSDVQKPNKKTRCAFIESDDEDADFKVMTGSQKSQYSTDKEKVIEKTIVVDSGSQKIHQRIASLKFDIQIKQKKIEEMEQSEIYKKKHNLNELKLITQDWKRGCQEALSDLLPLLNKSNGTDMDMASLLKQMNVPFTLVGFNEISGNFS